MTKKHFQVIARIIDGCYRDSPNEERRLGIDDVAYALSRYFQSVNPAFDSTRFLAACKLVKEPAGLDLNTAELD